ncbi:MAG: cobalamin biosynthesis protein [Verrucomicrobia bacterium]|nr:cobalamin biosynthesis protein [Verrucomicrobiota bacterium]
MKIALITLSNEGYRIAQRLAGGLERVDLFAHTGLPGGGQAGASRAIKAKRFDSIKNLSRKIFNRYSGLVYIAPCGAVVRAIASWVRHKTVDPAVVVVDAGGRYAISLLSGHEGGANALAFKVANIIGAEPVISTTTEAVKRLIVGVGCRRGTSAEAIIQTVRSALRKVRARLEHVRAMASADIKSREPGLLEAAQRLGLSVRFIPSDEIISTTRKFQRSSFVAAKVNLPAVAEPAALLAGRRTRLILPKTRFIHGVTIAVARENFL